MRVLINKLNFLWASKFNPQQEVTRIILIYYYYILKYYVRIRTQSGEQFEGYVQKTVALQLGNAVRDADEVKLSYQPATNGRKNARFLAIVKIDLNTL